MLNFEWCVFVVACANDSALDEIDYARGDSMHLNGIRCGKNYHHATPRESRQQRDDVPVEQHSLAGERLVEQNRARRTDQCLRQRQSLQQTR